MPRLRSTVRLIGWILLAIVALAALLVGAALWQVHRSVPTLDGQARLPELQANVTISRDALGTAVVKGANRFDVARGLGFVHAQERFFEMDLTRRSAAGELSALFGSMAIERDKLRRTHRLRAMLTARLARMDAGERALLQAYADGVNAGLAHLGTRPWQYELLRAEPARWQPVDSLLVVAEMFWMLQGSSVQEGLARAQLRECVGDAAYDWLEPRGGRWDAALDGSVLQPGAMPGPEVLDLRKPAAAASAATSVVARAPMFLDDAAAPDRQEPLVGSNNWAVSGARSVTGDAMLANDMHLSLGVPAIWFRAQFEIGAGADALVAEGVTLPGVPAMVVGSNGHVAWGFTNSYGQWFDWIQVPEHPDAALLTHTTEVIAVKGGADVKLEVAQFAGLPIVEHRGTQRYALSWVADFGDAYNLGLDQMLLARDAASAARIGARSGIPQQNLLVADSRGAVAWTIAGARFVAADASDTARFGHFAPRSLARFASAAPADGPGEAAAAPIIQRPQDGVLWSANARTYDPVAGLPQGRDRSAGVRNPSTLESAGAGRDLTASIGDGGYDLGARAQQIRDRLAATPKFDEKMLAAIQFDDEARFLRPWAARIAAVSGQRPEVTRLLAGWNGRADADQAGYRLLRETRKRALDALWAAWVPALGAARGCDGHEFDWHARFEYAAGQALAGRPSHLLPRGFATWDAFLLAQVDATVADMTRQGARALSQASWGEKNASHIGHPLARALPVLSRWLDMPSVPQAGDGNMPRVAAPGFGQSERLVVAPGHEERATLSMPGGQSGHPMSPYYGAGHDDWVAGRATPLLAGTAEHVLTLVP